MRYSVARCNESGNTDEGDPVSESSSTVDQAWLTKAVVTESPEAIVVTDPQGRIDLWNAGAANMFGYSAEDALGASLDLIIPVKLRDRHWRGYEHTMQTGVTKYGDTLLGVPATHQDGRQLSIEFSVALLRDDAGTIVGIAAVMREVSERRATEKALRTARRGRADCDGPARQGRRADQPRHASDDVGAGLVGTALHRNVIRRVALAPSRCSRPRRCDCRRPPRRRHRDGTRPCR